MSPLKKMTAGGVCLVDPIAMTTPSAEGLADTAGRDFDLKTGYGQALTVTYDDNLARGKLRQIVSTVQVEVTGIFP